MKETIRQRFRNNSASSTLRYNSARRLKPSSKSYQYQERTISFQKQQYNNNM